MLLKNSIRTKLTLCILLVAMISLSFFAYVGYINTKKAIINREEKDLEIFFEDIEAKIIKFFYITKRDVLFLKGLTEENLYYSDIERDIRHKEELKNIYKHFLKNNIQYEEVKFIDRVGHEIISVKDQEFRDNEQQDYLKDSEALKNGEIYISDIKYTEEINKSVKATIRYITPIYKNNSLKGFLVFSINMQYLLKDIEKDKLQSKYPKTVLVDNNGYYLLYPDKEKKLDRLNILNTDENFKIDYPELVDKIFTSKTQKIQINKQSMLAWYPVELKALNSKKIIIFMEMKKANYLHQLNLFRYYYLFNVIIAVLIIIISGSIISFHITKPVLKIVEAVEAIGKGHFDDFNLDIKTGDELELLSYEIKKMTYDLRDMYKNMEDQVQERTKELHLAHKELEEMATKDSLTGLYNRHYFNQYIQNFDNDNIHRNLMILIIDVDKFKYINDNYGHNIGDIILKKVANILKGSTRENDLTVRYGGDEFLVALSDSKKEYAEIYIDKVKKSLDEWNRESDILKHELTFSIGYNEYNDDKHILEVINAADKMMYENKVAKRKKQTGVIINE